jgi:hypothetical protein
MKNFICGAYKNPRNLAFARPGAGGPDLGWLWWWLDW